MELPSTLQDIDKLIATQTQENIHLDYKDNRAIDKNKREEISKDVSAFANSDGGTIIYGVTEQNHLPVARDNGVDQNRYSREWLEQVINSNINPRIDGIQIIPIPVSNENSLYVVGIPKSFRGPHQAADKKYYKRFNFQSVPMEDYEINDIRSRQNLVPPLISVAAELKQNAVYLLVENVGKFPASDVHFLFPKGITRRKGRELPKLLKDGAKVIPPSSRYPYLYHVFTEIANDPTLHSLEVDVSYFHPVLGNRITENFQIDFMNYFDTIIEESELHELSKNLKDSLQKLTREIEKTNQNLETISAISNPTGLDLSLNTIQNLSHVLAQDGQVEKINPEQFDYRAFRMVLGVDFPLAFKLQGFFEEGSKNKKLSEIEGITDEIIAKMKKYFDISEDSI
jgi:hypothetical protein